MTNQTAKTSSNTENEVTHMAIASIIIPIISVVIATWVVLVGAIAGVTAYKCKNTYFSQAGPEERLKNIRFYIDKHTIFRRFSLIYSTIHYILYILSIVTTLTTVYMVVDSSVTAEIQVIFLLLAAIFSSLVITLRFDKIGGCYAQAMRILEEAILTYLAAPSPPLPPLVEANSKAEQIIENNYF